MKLEKRTKENNGTQKRWYEDACGTALALEFFGERWSLLVMRELLLGPRRFSEIRANLPGVSANVLTQRLEGLEGAGILTKRKLPTPGVVHVYELTEWGYLSEPIFQEMGRWSTRSRRHDPTLFLSPVSAMLSLRAMIDDTRAKDERMTIAFRFPTDAFVGELADGVLVIRRGEVAATDAVFITDTTTFAATVYGKRPFAESEAAGLLRLVGDRDIAARFVSLFSLPEKIAD